MTDEEYLFRQTEIEHKKLGYGDKHKKRGGGRYVRLPSDHMTKKEREAMNGEVTTYTMNRPITKAELYRWPTEIQLEYLQGLVDKFHPEQAYLSEMLGTSKPVVCNMLKTLGIKTDRRGPNTGTPMDKDGWKRFIGGEEPQEKPEIQPVEVKTEPEIPVAPPPILVATKEERPAVKCDLHNIALLLQSLAGTGAKLTIEVTL